MFEHINSETYIQFHLVQFDFQKKEDFFEKLFLPAIIDAYTRIEKSNGTENEIRDRFIWDIETVNPYTSSLFQKGLLRPDFERWINVSETQKRRLDMSFFLTGIEFTVECKLLKNASKQYLDEGINRFIITHYASKEHDAGMIGFVQGDIVTIQNEMKAKVAPYYPSLKMPDYLKKTCCDYTNSFQSHHLRSNNTDLRLYHLFFSFH